MQEGHGMCQWADGTAYKGTWKGGVRDGRGTFTRPDGYVYEGEWRADAQQGHGTCRFDDGSRSHTHPATSLNGCMQRSMSVVDCQSSPSWKV